MQISIAGESVQLLPQRALYWPSQRLLVVADIHFGKAAAFRAQGVPVPHGTTTENLARLQALVDTLEPQHILFLGDFLHGKASHASNTMNAIRQWRDRMSHLSLTLVRGNHDSHAGDPPADLRIDVVDEPHRIGPFIFCHHPHRVANAYVFAGHVHPVFRLATKSDAVRLPCFQIGPETGLLPSFGEFTGGHPVVAAAGERIFVTAGDRVFPIPT